MQVQESVLHVNTMHRRLMRCSPVGKCCRAAGGRKARMVSNPLPSALVRLHRGV